MVMWFDLMGWGIALFWLVSAVRAIRFYKESQLSRLSGSDRRDIAWPKLSIIVPARNEAPQISDCLASLLSSDYPALEIIAVNDRSTDQTGFLMERLATTDPRLTVVHIDQLPAGWLGKTHALHRGAQQATGDYFLFTDGDVLFARQTLRLAVRYAIDRQTDHLCLLPRALTQGYWETALTQFVALLFVLTTRPWAVNRSARGAYSGVGAFNLVRSEAYQHCGGHAAVKLDVVDDMALGHLFRQRGLRSRILVADDLLSLRWHSGVRGLIRGVEKNSFAAMGFSLIHLALFTLLFSLAFAMPYLGLANLAQAPYWGYACAVLILHGTFAYWNHTTGNPWSIGLSVPIVALLCLWALWRSALITLLRGGIQWRETFYPLAVLRKKNDPAAPMS